jgi:hypothetical protein
MDRDEQIKQHEAAMAEDGYVLNPPGYELLNSWTFIMHNLHFAAWAIEQLLAEEPEDRGGVPNTYEEYARFSAMIISYARCFVSGVKKLSADHIFKNEPDLRAIHDRMVAIRHSTLAHGQESEYMCAKIGVKEDAGNVSLVHYFTIMTPRGDFQSYSKVIAFVRQYVWLQLNRVVTRIEGELGKRIEMG